MTMSYSTPGVHVNEITPAPAPMSGASTSVAAFVGAVNLSDNGISFAPPVQAFTNFTQFKKAFTNSNEELPASDVGFGYLANAVYGFFNNGGTRCFVTVVDTATVAAPSAPTIQDSMRTAMYTVAMSAPYSLSAADANALLDKIGDNVQAALVEPISTTPQKIIDAIQVHQPTHYLEPLLNQAVRDAVTYEATATPDGGGMESLTGMDETTQANLVTDLTNAGASAARDAAAERSTEITPLSNVSIRQALTLLEPFQEISIVAAPGLTSKSQWEDLRTHCEDPTPPNSPLNRFAILDCAPGQDWATTTPLAPLLPDNKSDSAAIYFPWIQITDVTNTTTNQSIFAPPSGHMAGVYARVDATRGVFKAPANEAINGTLGLQYNISNNQQGPLNDGGVDCIRRLNGGILVWGARTLKAVDTDAFKYISTRRTFNYIRASLEQGTQWAVFEPNTQALWGKITRNVTSFLKSLWQSGGLFGATQAEAFYVKCDEETNPPDVRAAGQVVTEIGVAITQPAEFVVFNLGVMTQGPSAS